MASNAHFLEDCTGATDRSNHDAALKMIEMQGGVFGALATSPSFIAASQDCRVSQTLSLVDQSAFVHLGRRHQASVSAVASGIDNSPRMNVCLASLDIPKRPVRFRPAPAILSLGLIVRESVELSRLMPRPRTTVMTVEASIVPDNVSGGYVITMKSRCKAATEPSAGFRRCPFTDIRTRAAQSHSRRLAQAQGHH